MLSMERKQIKAATTSWSALEVGKHIDSSMHCNIFFVWCTALSETARVVSPWLLHRAPAGCTLLQGERGVQCQHFTPWRLAGGRRDQGYVYAYVRQKCTMQSQKQWHFLTLIMVALSYNWTHPVPLFTFRTRTFRGKIYNLRSLFWIKLNHQQVLKWIICLLYIIIITESMSEHLDQYWIELILNWIVT